MTVWSDRRNELRASQSERRLIVPTCSVLLLVLGACSSTTDNGRGHATGGSVENGGGAPTGGADGFDGAHSGGAGTGGKRSGDGVADDPLSDREGGGSGVGGDDDAGAGGNPVSGTSGSSSGPPTGGGGVHPAGGSVGTQTGGSDVHPVGDNAGAPPAPVGGGPSAGASNGGVSGGPDSTPIAGSGGAPIGGSSGVPTGGSSSVPTGGGGGAASGGSGGIPAGGAGSGGAEQGGSANGGTEAGGSTDGSADACTDPGSTRSGGTEHCEMDDGKLDSGYYYQFWANGNGSACMTVFDEEAAFKCEWDGTQDVLARVGLQYDSTQTPDQIGTFAADFAFTGSGTETVFLGVYGYTHDPRVEFYIIEDWVNEPEGTPPVPGSSLDTITVDGGTYVVYSRTVGDGAVPIREYYSIRTEGRQCGHTSISQHFSEWAERDMALGQLALVTLFIEGISEGTGSYEFTRASIDVD